MKTVTINIGNSDNKLTQVEWSHFIKDIWDALMEYKLSAEIHFAGGSSPESPRQNYCWVIGLVSMNDLHKTLDGIRKKYRQNAIALTIGDTTFIKDEG